MTKDEQIQLLFELNQKMKAEIAELKLLIPRGNRTRGKSSQFKGVSYDRTHNCWRAQMRIYGKVRPLGTFPYTEQGEKDAAKAYRDAKEKKHELEKYYHALDEKKKEKRIQSWKATKADLRDGIGKEAADVFGSM